MALCAIVYERSFEAWFYAGDATFVYIGFFLFAVAVFNVQIVKPLTIYQRYAQLFRLSCIDEHSFHVLPNCLWASD